MARYATQTQQDYDDTDVLPASIGRTGREPPPEALLEAQLQALKAKDRDLIDSIAQQQESIRERDAAHTRNSSAPSQAMIARIVELEANHAALKMQMTNLVTVKDKIEDQLHSVPTDQPGPQILGNISTERTLASIIADAEMAHYLASHSHPFHPPRSREQESEFRNSQDYTEVVSTSGQAVYCFKPDGQLTYWGEMAEELFGFSAEEAIDRNVIELLCMESTYETAGHIISKMGMGVMWSGQFPLRKKNGEVFTAAITNFPLFDSSGALSSFIGVCSDARPFKEQLSQMVALPEDQGEGAEWQQPWRIPFASTLTTLAGQVMKRLGVRGEEGEGVGQVEESSSPRDGHAGSEVVPGLPGFFGPPGEGVESEGLNPSVPRLHVDSVAQFQRMRPAVTFAQDPVAQIIPPPSSSEEGEGAAEGLEEVTEGRGEEEWEGLGEWEIPWDELEMKDQIGQGASGTVFKGAWKGDDVAIKVFMDPDYSDGTLREFEKEIGIMQRLRHPNVLQFLGAVRTESHLCIVTQFLPRGSLFRILHRAGGAVPWPCRLRMALDIACGIAYLHSANPPVIHRDLKSSNLLVDRAYTVKVADFGLSKLKHATFLTARSGRGTPQWMAPEVLRNEPSDEKSDVYSFAVILWELATLEMPWSGLNPMQVVGAVGFMDKRLPLPPDLDPVIAELIETCWANDPRERPDFESIVEKLKAIQKPLTSSNKSNGSN